jgi:NADH dehydrogenase
MRFQSLCILGGTGFVGRHIANQLANTPVSLRVLTRHRERNRHLLPIPNLDLVETDIHDTDVLASRLDGVDAVINLVGVLHDSKGDGQGFRDAHVELPRRLVDACRRAGVGRLLHMSALGAAEDAPSAYLRSKGEGERLVLEAGGEDLAVTVFRPSVIFGPEDSFLNTFADMLRLAPILPLPTPQARFQPVYVGDVARAFVQSLENRDTFGRSYDLCGPAVYSLRELVEYCARLLGLKRHIIGLNDRYSRLQGRILQNLPGKPYTEDNYLSTRVDSVCGVNGLGTLGIHPTALDAVVPGYLGQRGLRRRYNEFRREARRH